MKKIIAVSGGFYFFGTETTAPEGYYALSQAAMFGGFSGGKGVAGVSRGDASSSVTLDRFEVGETLFFPITAVMAIMPSKDLFTLKTTKIR